MTYIRSFILSLIVIVCFTATSQTVSRSVISSAGTTLTSNGERVSWTLGEPVVGTMSGGRHQLGNGFFPSMDISVFLAEPEKKTVSNIEVYPNPSTSFVTIRNKENHTMEYKLTNLNGNLINQGNISSGDLLGMSGKSPGTYLLEVIDAVTMVKTSFKLVIK